MNDVRLPQPSHSWEDPEYSVQQQHSIEEAGLPEKGVDGTTKVNTSFKYGEDSIGVTFAINSEDLTIEGFSFKADSPDIYPPNNNRVASDEVDGVNEKKYSYWSTFQPSFMAQIASVMIDLMKLQMGMSFKETEVNLMQRHQKIEMAETMSELTKLLYDSQAMEQMIQAIGSFTNAAIGAIQLVSLTANIAKAEKIVDKRISEQQEKLTKAENADVAVGVGQDPALNQKAKTDKIAAEQRTLDDMKAGKQDAVFREAQRLDQLTSTRADILKQCVNGMTSMMSSYCKTDQGVIQSFKDSEQGIAEMVQADMQDSEKNRDALEAAFMKLVDLLKNMFDSNIRAKMIKG